MLASLAIVAVATLGAPSNDCVFQRYITGAVWQATDDARIHNAPPAVKTQLDVALSMQTAKEREVCGR